MEKKVGKLSKAARKRVETDFAARMVKDGVRWGTKTYLHAQYLYFTGAMVALHVLPPYWTICLMSGREILKNPEEIQKYQRRFNLTKKQAEKILDK